MYTDTKFADFVFLKKVSQCQTQFWHGIPRAGVRIRMRGTPTRTSVPSECFRLKTDENIGLHFIIFITYIPYILCMCFYRTQMK